MANKYFIAGVGRALLFEGDTLFADCRTLADSSITVGVTAEDIRGGEGNALYGQYYHDATFSLKLTDIMFNLDFVAAQVGSQIESLGNIFEYEKVTANASGEITLKAAPVAITTGGTAQVWYRLSSDGSADMQAKAAPSATVSGFTANAEYCVMYRRTVNADVVTISSQFIPKTVHAVLTVALYTGDSCNVTAATKAGSVVIDIPRLELSGAMDITMSATGAAQTPLEGNALASGCTGCDGKAIYATITQYLEGSNWYDDAQGLVIDDISGLVHPVSAHPVVTYAYYLKKAPRRLANNEYTLTAAAGSTGNVDDTNKTFSCANAGDSTLKVVAKNSSGSPIQSLKGDQTVTVQ